MYKHTLYTIKQNVFNHMYVIQYVHIAMYTQGLYWDYGSLVTGEND